MNNITVVIPCLETIGIVIKSIDGNSEIFSKYPIIVVNKNGGENYKLFASLFFNQYTSFWFARRFGLEFVKTKYVLNLDVDTVLPSQYIEKAIEILETHPEVGAVALSYADPYKQKHLAFGTSIWRTEQLKELYNWRLAADQKFNVCECEYMWNKLEKKGMKVETLPLEATHLKEHSPRVL